MACAQTHFANSGARNFTPLLRHYQVGARDVPGSLLFGHRQWVFLVKPLSLPSYLITALHYKTLIVELIELRCLQFIFLAMGVREIEADEGGNGFPGRTMSNVYRIKDEMRTCLSAILLLMTMEVAAAGPLEEANTAYDKGDFRSAEHMYNELSNQGDRIAQVQLGLMYDEGHGVPKITSKQYVGIQSRPLKAILKHRIQHLSEFSKISTGRRSYKSLRLPPICECPRWVSLQSNIPKLNAPREP